MGFALVVLLVWSTGHLYLARRLVRPMPRGRGRWLATVTLVLAAALPFVTMWIRRANPALAWTGPLSFVGFWAFGLSSVVFMLVLARDVWLVGVRLVSGVRRRLSTAMADNYVVNPQRRVLMANTVNMGIVGGAVSMSTVGGVRANATPAVKTVQVPIASLPSALHGFRIAQITDVHIGPTIGSDFLRRVVDVVNAESPDLIAITGDLVDGLVPHLGEDVRPLAGLRARHGTYFVTGNHEYYWDADAWIEFLRGLGIDVLLNEHRVITHGGAQLVVAGVTDHREGERRGQPSDPHKAARGCPDGVPKVLLAHQPRSMTAAARAGFDLQLSGHTHGGQYFPFNLLVYLTQPYVRGLHRAGNTWIYVSCGTGYWGPPTRVGVPAEITMVELVAEGDVETEPASPHRAS